MVPDVIALQEIHGWVYAPPTRSCGNGWANGVGDYDQLDVILKALEDMTRVRYRVAYMTGRVTHWGPPPPFSCDVFHAQAMLYNPSRLVNVTQREVGSRPHDDEAGLAGVAHLRRSLPLCNRGTGLMPLASLIDGPLQTDKCGRPTPSGPAHVTFSVKGYLAASHVRFEFRHAPGKFVDVFNVHPGNGVIEPDISNIRALLDAILPPPYAGASLLYPPILAGDFNALSIDGDFPEFVPVVQVPDDVMQIGVGKPERFPTQLRVVKVDERIVPDLPPGATCNTPEPAYLVSDHCAAFLRLEPDGPSARDLKGVFIDGPATAAAGSSFTLGAVPSGGGPAYRYRWSPGGFSTPSISLVAGAEGTVIQASVEVTDPVTGRTATNNKSVKATAAAPPPTCRAACATELARCLADPSNPTWPRPTYCGGEYQRCLAQCGP